MKPLVFLLSAILLSLAPLGAGERVILEEIVARVNNEIITLADLEQSRQLLEQELSQQYSGEELKRKLQEEELNLLRDLIDQSLLVQRAGEMGLSVETELIKRFDRMRQESGLATQEEFERQAAAEGLDLEGLRTRMRQQLLTQMVIQREVAGKVMLDAEEVRQYYLQHQEEMVQPESVRLREILVSTEDYSQAELPAREDRVRELLAKIRQGEPFDELARTYSDAPTAGDGGELGYFEMDKLAPNIREVVDKLLEKGVSDPFITAQGYLVLQLVERIPEGIPPFEKIESEIRSRLYFNQVQPALREYLSELRREAFVYVKSGYVDSGAVEPLPKPVRRGKRRRARRDD